MPVPKSSPQRRFTQTRAASGFSLPTSQRAISSRVISFEAPAGAKIAGRPGETVSPFDSRLPRAKTRVSRVPDSGRSTITGTIVPGMPLSCFFNFPRVSHDATRADSLTRAVHSGRLHNSIEKFRTGVA